MEQLNRVELRGNVGSIRIQRIGDNNVANFSLATNLAYKSNDGYPIIETTWHNVTAWEGKSTPLDGLTKGCKVHIIGRIRKQRYIGADGIERSSTEIVAQSLQIVV